jgi:hypothetical protein
MAATTRATSATVENHTQAQRNDSHGTTQNHDGDEEEHACYSNRSQSHDSESYTPRSPLASLPPERGFGQRDSPIHSRQQQQAAQQLSQ